MGGKWEVEEWIKNLSGDMEYFYNSVYRGPSLLRALIAAIRAKRAGSGCVKIKWRG